MDLKGFFLRCWWYKADALGSIQRGYCRRIISVESRGANSNSAAPKCKAGFFFFPFWNFQRKPNESFMDCFFFLQPLWLLIHIGNETFLFRTPTARSCATQQNNLRKCVWECWTFYRYMCQHRTHQNMALEAFLNVFLQTINIILTS